MKSKDKRKGKLEYIGAVEAISGNKGIAMAVILVILCLFSVQSVSAVQVSENVEFQTPGTSTTLVMGSDFTFDKIEVHSTYLKLDNAAISVHPSVGSITFTLFDFSTDYKKWSEECSNPDATTTYTLSGLKTNTPYLVIVSGATYGSYTSNNSGYVSFTYSGGYSDVVFEMTEAGPTPSPSPSATPTSTPTSTPPFTGPIVNIYASKPNFTVGDAGSISLSAVNVIGNPTMTVQTVLTVPSGVEVTGTTFSKGGAGTYTSTFEVAPGDSKHITANVKSNEEGEFVTQAEVIYYFEDEVDDTHTLQNTFTFEVSQSPTPAPAVTPTPSDVVIPDWIKKILAVLSGIAIIVAIIIYLWLKGKRRGEGDRGRVEVTIEEE